MKIISNLKIFFKTVFSDLYYVVLAILVSLGFFIFSVWLSSYNLLYHTLTSNLLSFSYKLALTFNFWELIRINLLAPNLFLVSLVAILFGINISALVFYIKKQIAISRSAKISVWASLISFLGIGCLSCGSVIISSLFGFSATAAFIGFLPFHGYEFGIIGILSLLISIYLLSKKINNNFACEV
ncbi:MAG: hypothetical protein COU81_00150 [Candidatus Portnoybacteria bacterium CG10_big_fil_rev_8_21_14_0_10_36_7]|uniref:Uncharacterized protein n=1 Tax=Candidatus Portnoybacteria bacterium CG10_big_fil_rev_8_21_14_0_10_36_7 TaxID=1974812 RepID=A0A2M8KF39_9BACT|nr:MAG: hypothetical protein COU81_00150 [Candidatus Portnoybacteria bacterium CG10_big_fil_rev_8_21_14_0_10_36_7]